MKRYAPATAYCAYVALERGLRFGRRTDDEALGKQLLTDARDAGGDYAVLATAALDLLSGQPAKARSTVSGLAQKAPQDFDVAVTSPATSSWPGQACGGLQPGRRRPPQP